MRLTVRIVWQIHADHLARVLRLHRRSRLLLVLLLRPEDLRVGQGRLNLQISLADL